VDAELEDMAALRQEMLSLLRQQMEALDSPAGLTVNQLRECYLRQNRVQELREMLQAASVSPEQQGVSPKRDAAQTRDRHF
jgi:uncharacterized protein YnzC (UPF0291/DUF896 family)